MQGVTGPSPVVSTTKKILSIAGGIFFFAGKERGNSALAGENERETAERKSDQTDRDHRDDGRPPDVGPFSWDAGGLVRLSFAYHRPADSADHVVFYRGGVPLYP